MAIDWSIIGQAKQPLPAIVAQGSGGGVNSTSSQHEFSLGDPGKEFLDARNKQAETNKTNIEAQTEAYKLQSQKDTDAAAAQDSQELRDAAAKGEQALFDAHDKQGDPMFKYTVLDAKQKVQNTIAQTAQHQAEAAKANGESAKDAPTIIQNTALTFGSIADKAHQAEQQAKQAVFQQAQSQQQSPGSTQIPLKPGITQAVISKANAAGQQAGQQVYSLLTGQLDPHTQQNLKDNQLDQWNLVTNTALHSTAITAIADQKQAQEEKDAAKYATPESKDAITKANLQIKVQNNTATDVEKQTLQNMTDTENSKAAAKESLVAKLVTDPKTYQTLQASRDSAKVLQQYTSTNLALLDKAQKEGLVFGPGAGKLSGQYTATGQEISKMNASIVPQTVKLLGIPATALRSTAMISLIKDMNPSNSNYIGANRWVLKFMNYLGATEEHEAWQKQANMVEYSKDSDPKGYNTWMKQNPDPLTQVEKPNFEELYKMNPNFKNAGIEQDIQTAQKAGQDKVNAASGQSGTMTADKMSNIPEGQIGTYKDGRQTVYTNGQWNFSGK